MTAQGSRAVILVAAVLIQIVRTTSTQTATITREAATVFKGGGAGEEGDIDEATTSSHALISRSTPTPWLLPPTIKLPYEGLHNDLSSLLQRQSTKTKWVSVFMFSSSISWWTMNCIYSYIKYGKSVSYILAAPDASSLDACMQLRLPCLNMSAIGITVLSKASSPDTTAQSWKSPAYYDLVWAKVDLVSKILKTGHHVHFSDVDVVYLRGVWSSYNNVYDAAGPDAIFMEEQWQVDDDPQNNYVNSFNTGVYAIRSNNRSMAFMSQWYGSGSKMVGNQPFINNFAARDHASYGFCHSVTSCNMMKRRHKAAILLHPSQSSNGGCPPGGPLDHLDACSDKRLFIHYICSPQGWGVQGAGSKGFVLKLHRLKLLDPQGEAIYDDGGHVESVQIGSDASKPRHPFLPCVQSAAWLNLVPRKFRSNGDTFPIDS